MGLVQTLPRARSWGELLPLALPTAGYETAMVSLLCSLWRAGYHAPGWHLVLPGQRGPVQAAVLLPPSSCKAREDLNIPPG